MAGETLVSRVGIFNNLNEPEPLINRKSTILGLNITWLVLAWICVAGRLFVRFRVVHSPGWDDFMVVLALFATTTGLVSLCVASNYGAGQHFLLLTQYQQSHYLRVFYVCNASYTMATGLIKMSLLHQYLRIYQRGSRLYNTCRYLLIFTAFWCVVYSTLAWVPCIPIEAYWEQVSHPGVDNGAICYAYGTQYVAGFTATYESHATINALLDILVMALPLPLYFGADTARRTKLGLVGIVTMGMLINIFSAWRFASTVEHGATTYPTFDPTWYAPISVMMAALEVGTACICASIPVFWGPVMERLPQLLGDIFVTREVDVHHEDRDLELARESTGGKSYEAGRFDARSRAGSQASLHKVVVETAMACKDARAVGDGTGGRWMHGASPERKMEWV